MRRSIPVILALAAAASGLACDQAARAPESTSGEARDEAGLYRSDGRRFSSPTAPALAGRQAVSEAEQSADRLRALDVADVAPSMIIRTGRAAIEVDSLEPAVALVRDLAARLGGHVANASMQTGAGQLRSATMELKIPAARFDDALAGLNAIGKLESVDVQTQDVGEEYVDVQARVANARRLEQRLITILATRTGKLQDVLEVEQALARVREEIERYEGRLRYLRARATLSTLTVYVHEPVPVVGRVGSSVVGEAFKQAWRNFVGLLAFIIQALGIVVPLGALAAGGWYVYRWWGKRRRA